MLVLSVHTCEPGTDDAMACVTITVPPSTEPQQVRVKLVGTNEGRAKLGFEAERDIKIVRDTLVAKVN